MTLPTLTPAALLVPTLALATMASVSRWPRPHMPTLTRPIRDWCSADPANTTPDVLDGHVNAFAQVGDTMIVGGDFSQVEQGGTVYERDNMFAFSVSTGEVLDSFAARPTARCTTSNSRPTSPPSLVGGSFFKVNGVPHTARIARGRGKRRRAASRLHIARAERAGPRRRLRARPLLHRRRVHRGRRPAARLRGRAERRRVRLRRRRPDCQRRQHERHAPTCGPWTSAPTARRPWSPATSSTVNGQPRGQLARHRPHRQRRRASAPGRPIASRPSAVRTSTPTCATSRSRRPASSSWSSTPAARWASRRQACSATRPRRWDLAAGPDAQPAWVDYTGGDTLTAAIVDDNAVYIGGHMRWLNNSFGHNEPAHGRRRARGRRRPRPAERPAALLGPRPAARLRRLRVRPDGRRTVGGLRHRRLRRRAPQPDRVLPGRGWDSIADVRDCRRPRPTGLRPPEQPSPCATFDGHVRRQPGCRGHRLRIGRPCAARSSSTAFSTPAGPTAP